MAIVFDRLSLALVLLAPSGFATTRSQEGESAEAAFPASSAIAEGVSPASLAKLDELVQSFVDDGDIVGAELMVIVNNATILHEAYGWGDREAEEPMETGSVFCVRSMTKPLIGASILMLIEDKALDLDDPIAKYLPAFDGEGTRDITVEHLLTHTGGFPMSLLIGENLRELDGIQAVADLGADYDLDFEPGSAFTYSDQGTDTLTALIEVVSEMPVAEFVRTRLLEPLGMEDSACVLEKDHPLRPRALPKYMGSPGDWSPFWSPEDEPLFPFFLGSQGLYSTLEDYARFTEFYMRKGRSRTERLLKSRYARKALNPGPYPLNSPTGFPNLTTAYGYLMQLWTQPDQEDNGGGPELVAFGHTGSDGTHAWAFPKQKAMVLYFTQSRDNITGLRVEESLGELLLGVPYDPDQDAPPLEQYLGYYWEGEGDLYRAIIRDGDDLALEILGKAIVPLKYAGADSWKLPDRTVLAFDRSEAGDVIGYSVGDHKEYRFEPSADLLSAEELASRVAGTHRFDLLETLGPIRMESALEMAKVGITGRVTATLAWPDRFRYDGEAGGQSEVVAFDGDQAWYRSTSKPRQALEGERAESTRLDNPFARFGDWQRWYPRLQVIQRVDWAGGILVVRTGDTSAPAKTLYVHEESGRLAREDSFVHLEGMGRVGQRISYEDYREYSGMLIPYLSEIEYAANPMMGSIVTTLESIELGVELPAGGFDLSE